MIWQFQIADCDSPIEAWYCAFSTSTREIYSGGDDSTIRSTTLSTIPLDDPDNIIVTSKISNSRGHDAGVTAILPLPGTDLLLTGSYDEHTRLFGGDLRKCELNIYWTWCFIANETFIAPKAELKIEGGGVWRLKMMDEGRREGGVMRYRILASCMHAGKSQYPSDLRVLGQILTLRRSQDPRAENLRYRVRV
jgi:diphthamide biosynthesis protein 7